MNISTGSVWLSDFWPHTAHGSIFWTWLTAREWSIEDDNCQPVDGFPAEGMSSQRLHWVGWQQLEPSMPEPEQKWTKHFTASSHSHLVNLSWTFNESLHVLFDCWTAQELELIMLCVSMCDEESCMRNDAYLHTPNCWKILDSIKTGPKSHLQAKLKSRKPLQHDVCN